MTTFYCLKQVLSKIQAMEFTNDKRTDFSRQSTNRKLTRSDFLTFNAENVINCVHNKVFLWDPSVNGSEEEK